MTAPAISDARAHVPRFPRLEGGPAGIRQILPQDRTSAR